MTRRSSASRPRPLRSKPARARTRPPLRTGRARTACWILQRPPQHTLRPPRLVEAALPGVNGCAEAAVTQVSPIQTAQDPNGKKRMVREMFETGMWGEAAEV